MPDAADGYEIYYTEKLWELLPAHHRHADGEAPQHGALRALIAACADEAARLRRSADRMWEDQSADLCDAWVLPYLADLLGTRLVPAHNPRGRRADVAKTIHYRRRSGTPRLLDELLADIAGWDGTVVEGWRRVARCHHLWEPRARDGSAPWSSTPRHGLADLHPPSAADHVDGAHDAFAHLVDVRQPRGLRGLHHQRTVVLHAQTDLVGRLRLRATVTANPNRFLCDPAARNRGLWQPRQRDQGAAGDPGGDRWRMPAPWEVQGPIACRLLGHDVFRLSAAHVETLAGEFPVTPVARAWLASLVGHAIPGEARLHRLLGAGGAPVLLDPLLRRRLRELALADDCGLARLVPTAVTVLEGGVALPAHRVGAGDLSAWSAPALDRRVIIDSVRGRLLILGAAPVAAIEVVFHLGSALGLGATPLARAAAEAPGDSVANGGGAIIAAQLPTNGRLTIRDSERYQPVADLIGAVDSTVQAVGGQRPYLLPANDWVLDAAANDDARLRLDGLWVGAAALGRILILRSQNGAAGSYEEVRIQACTLEPGRRDGAVWGVPPLPLVIEGYVERLVIERSLTAAIRLGAGGFVGTCVVCDSVVREGSGGLAIDLPGARVLLRRATVIGGLVCREIDAGDSLVAGLVQAADLQKGCFRHSASFPGSTLPHPYRAAVAGDPARLFDSLDPDQPRYAALSDAASPAIATGAEDGGEMGAGNGRQLGLRLRSLAMKVDEYLPLGIRPAYRTVSGTAP